LRIEVVEVGGREAAAVQRHQGAKFRRDDRDHAHHHPLGLVAALAEGLEDFQALGGFLELDLGGGGQQFLAQTVGLGDEVDLLEQALDRLGADLGGEAVVAELLLEAHVLVLGKELVLLQAGQAGFGDDVVFEVEHPLDVLERHVQHHGDAAGQRLQEPDVGDRAGQFDVAHPLAPDAGQGDLDAALLADNALVFHALVLAAQALVVFGRTEDAGAEQAVAFRLERPIVDRFRLLDLTERPRADLLGAGERDADLVERRRGDDRIEDIENFLIHFKLVIPGPGAERRRTGNLLQGS
jgi:hypothetical protein